MVAAAIAFVLLIDPAMAQLSREDKQLFLDTHNYRRASVRAADMNQIVSLKNVLPHNYCIDYYRFQYLVNLVV